MTTVWHCRASADREARPAVRYRLRAGKSVAAIAVELGIDEATVERIVARREKHLTGLPIGEAWR